MTNSVPDNEISLNLPRLTTYEDTACGRKGTLAVIALKARLPRSLRFNVYHDPLPNE